MMITIKYVLLLLIIFVLFHSWFVADKNIRIPFVWKYLTSPLLSLNEIFAQHGPTILPITAFQVDNYFLRVIMQTQLLIMVPFMDLQLLGKLASVQSEEIYTSSTFNITLYSPPTSSQHGSNEKTGLAIYVHGGGFSTGSAEDFSLVTKYLSLKSRRKVASIEYRLAIKHLYPAASEDCIDATKWLLLNSLKYGFDPNDVVLVGDSSGGNLIMGIAMNISIIEQRPVFKRVIPIYPALSLHNFQTESYKLYQSDPPGLLKRNKMLRYYSYYIFGNDSFANQLVQHRHISNSILDEYLCKTSEENHCVQILCQGNQCKNGKEHSRLSNIFDQLLKDPYLTPFAMKYENAKYLPPIDLVACNNDVLRDDSVIFSKLLETYNVTTTLKVFDHCFHGSINFFFLKEIGTELIDYIALLL